MATSIVLLQSLHDDGIKLLDFLRFLAYKEQDSKNIQKIYNKFIGSLRKITIANMFAKRRVISVSGLQGQGKSTMVKNMYSTAGNTTKPHFKTNLARGEKFPIFITEYNQNSVQYLRWFYNLNKGMEEAVSLEQKEVAYEEFEKIATNGDSETVLLEMRVPYTYFKDDGMTGFLLLPGFEERETIYNSLEDDYWKQLIDFCTACANINLFVTRANTLADGEISSVQKKFRDLDILKNSVFLISGSETIDVGAKKEIIDNCINIFKLTDEKKQDIIFITNSPASENKWSKAVYEKIIDLRQDINNIEQNENEFMKSVIYDDLVDLKYELKDVLENIGIIDLYKDSKLSNYKNVLDKAWLEINKLYSKQLREQTAIAYNKSIEKLDLYYENKENSWFDEFRKKFFGANAKDIVLFKKAIASFLKDENDQSLVAQLNSKALENATPVVVDNINRYYEPNKVGEFGKDNEKSIVPENNIKLNLETCNDLMVLLNEKDGVLQHDNFNKTLIILMNMAFWRFQKCVPDISTKYSEVLADSANKRSEIKVPSFDNQMKEYNAGIVKAASVLGVSIDAAADGKIDSIPAIAKLFGIAEGYVTAAVGVGAIAYLTSNFVKGINRKEVEDYYQTKSIIENIYTESQRALLEEAEELKNEIERTILTRLGTLLGVGTGSADLINAQIYFNALDTDIRKLKGIIDNKNGIIR